MESNYEKAENFERARILKGHPRSFKVSINWEKQKPFVADLMTNSEYDKKDGIDEVRCTIAASYRIKIQSYVSALMYKKAGIKNEKGTNLSETMDYLRDDTEIVEIQDACLDWYYGKQAVNSESSQIKSLHKKLKARAEKMGISVEELMTELGLND